MNLITEETTKEQVESEYKTYPAVNGSLKEKPFYESRYENLFYEIPLGSKVLDVGCNDGTFMEMLKDKRKCDVFGVDISETALEEAKKKGLNVQIANVESLPFEGGSFDVVLGMELLSHLHDPAKALKEMRRVLKRTGCLLGSCPHENLEKYVWDDKRLHRRYFKTEDLRVLLEESFSRNWIKTLTGGQFAISLAESFLADSPVEILFKSGTDILGWDSALQDKSILRCWFGFTQGPGTVYYRMSGFADKMQKLGAETHYDPYDENDFDSPSLWTKKIRYLPHERRFTNSHMVDQLEHLLKASDLSVFQVTDSRDILLLLTTAKKGVIKKPMWTEIDDWFFDLPPYNLASHAYHPNSERESVAFDQIKLSDGLICSTVYLKEKLNQVFPDKPVYVVRNSLDFDLWDKVQKKTKLHEEKPGLIRIAYTGCENHSGDMEMLKDAFYALLDEFPTLEIVSLPKNYESFTKHPRLIEWKIWAGMGQYPQMISDWEPDIGIAPLRDNELNRAKSNLRWLEYGALKVPCVASKVYPFEKSITHGKDGILVSNNSKSWYENLRYLILNKEIRIEMGENAYKVIKNKFNMDLVAKEYLSVLKSIKHDFLKKGKS